MSVTTLSVPTFLVKHQFCLNYFIHKTCQCTDRSTKHVLEERTQIPKRYRFTGDYHTKPCRNGTTCPHRLKGRCNYIHFPCMDYVKYGDCSCTDRKYDHPSPAQIERDLQAEKLDEQHVADMRRTAAEKAAMESRMLHDSERTRKITPPHGAIFQTEKEALQQYPYFSGYAIESVYEKSVILLYPEESYPLGDCQRGIVNSVKGRYFCKICCRTPNYGLQPCEHHADLVAEEAKIALYHLQEEKGLTLSEWEGQWYDNFEQFADRFPFIKAQIRIRNPDLVNGMYYIHKGTYHGTRDIVIGGWKKYLTASNAVNIEILNWDEVIQSREHLAREPYDSNYNDNSKTYTQTFIGKYFCETCLREDENYGTKPCEHIMVQ